MPRKYAASMALNAPFQVRDVIYKIAEKNKRSASMEMLMRLEKSLREEGYLDENNKVIKAVG